MSTTNPDIYIKVIGVGGGGGNAVNHMYREGNHRVTFLLCNTDRQVLRDSPIPNPLQFGEGLGAGGRPERGRQAAVDSLDKIKERLNDGTRMVFITAGMGGGTGTGAAPVIAQCAKEMGILTVGIVTIPFRFEGVKKIDQALDGVEEISKHVDALLVINNERLREVYSDLTVLNAFRKADDTLSVAAKSITDIIMVHGIINVDFQDVTTVLKDGGVAIMSTGYGEGDGRVKQAIERALASPLLNNNDIFKSKKVLLSISFSAKEKSAELTMEEMNDVHDFMSRFGDDAEIKFGLATDDELGNQLKVTVLATGFGLKDVPGMDTKHEMKDEELITQMKEEEMRKAKRRGEFYGKDKGQCELRRPHHLYVFNDGDLDNDNVIAMVEDTPTYKRSKEVLAGIKSKTAMQEETPENTAAAGTAEGENAMITF